MAKRAFLHIAFVVFLIFGYSHFKAFGMGHLPVMNYGRPDYDFGTQNWDIAQDELGKIYIANYNGMMCFDGLRWQKYYLPNYSTVRCLYYDEDKERLYAGGTEEFGYFSFTEDTPTLQYHSLTHLLPKDTGPFSEVWDILDINGAIFFRCDNCLFRLIEDKLEVKPIKGRISASSHIGRHLYLGLEDGRILSLRDGEFNSLKEEQKIGENKIVSILPYDDDALLIATPLDGLYTMKGNGEVSPVMEQYKRYLTDNQLFCATWDDGVYVLGTVTGGALIIDNNTNEVDLVNKDSGMKNNTVLKACFDANKNLWLCLDNGVTYVALDSPCRMLIGESNFIGAGYASAIKGNNLLLGTNQGLYTRSLAGNNFDTHPELKLLIPGQIWSITPAGNELFISSDTGLYLYDGVATRQVKDLPGVFKTHLLPGKDDRAIASTYDSFHLLKKDPGGNWIDGGKINGSNDLKGNFLIDNENRLWTSHWQKGIYVLSYNDTQERFTSCRLFDKNSGLPANDNNTLAFFESAPLSSTYQGFFNLNFQNLKAERNEELSELLKNGRRGHLKEIDSGTLVLVDEDGVMLTKRSPDGQITSREISGPGLFHETIPGFTDVSKFSGDELLVSTLGGFTIVDTKKKNNSHRNSPFISAVYANHDSLVYQSPLSLRNNQEVKLAPDYNSLKFEFAYPECNFGENAEFSSYLENYEKEWSPFSKESSREYTKLSDGKYVLHLKVKDNYSGEVLESAFGFTVAPPWFRSSWAKSVYTILSFIALFLLFFSVRKKMFLMKDKIEKRKEKELDDLRKESEREAMLKDVEIAGLKNEQLEQEIKYKSDELSSTTMSLISKNEILRDIGDQISRIQKLSTEVPISVLQKNLSKLQASIEENISKDADWTTFNKNFDVVYGDYMKRLLKQHPGLSQSEKRLCCYIRMGLSSKEIAPLINISFRSVEMARYRLRKKMNLKPEAVLSDYLSAI